MCYSIDCQFFPCVAFFKKIAKESHIKISIYDRFKKASFHNRCVIASANGLLNLTVPVRGGREQKILIKDVEIDRTADWQTRHWRSIVAAYSKAPFFEYYSAEVKRLVYSSEKKLADLNISILGSVFKMLKLKIEINIADPSMLTEYDNAFGAQFLPRSFQDGPEIWSPRYSQVFEDRLGFQPNLSILDLLFCEGPNAPTLLSVV